MKQSRWSWAFVSAAALFPLAAGSAQPLPAGGEPWRCTVVLPPESAQGYGLAAAIEAEAPRADLLRDLRGGRGFPIGSAGGLPTHAEREP